MKKSSIKLNALAFIIGLGSVTQVNIGITHLSFSEIFLTLMVPVLLTQGHSLQGSHLKLLLVFLTLWILAAVTSDFYVNNTYMTFALKGIVRLVVLGCCIYSLHYVFLQNALLWRYYVIGAFISLTLGFLVLGMSSTVVDELAGQVRGHGWEQTYNYIFMAFIAVLNAWFYGRFPRLICLLLVFAGLLNIAMGSRSTGGIGVLSGATVYYFTIFLKNNTDQKVMKLPISKMILVTILALVVIFAVYSAYTYTASEGLLGEEALAKYEKQSQNDWGILFGGRHEVVAGTLAVLDAPYIGHGSFALDFDGYRLRALELIGDYELMEQASKQDGVSYIPAHSKILEAWLTHGFLGGLFWLYLLYFYIRFINRGLFSFPPLVGALSILIMNAFWSFCFSPISFRVVEASSIALIFAIADHQKSYTVLSSPRHKRSICNSLRASVNNKLVIVKPAQEPKSLKRKRW